MHFARQERELSDAGLGDVGITRGAGDGWLSACSCPKAGPAIPSGKVPDDRQVVLTKPEIAIEEIDRIRAAGARFGCTLADAACGMSAPFSTPRQTTAYPLPALP
jgi:hypothetical protein